MNSRMLSKPEVIQKTGFCEVEVVPQFEILLLYGPRGPGFGA
jgi:hypothetical protein